MMALLSFLRTCTTFLGWNISELWRVLSAHLGKKWALVIIMIGIAWVIATNAEHFLVMCAGLLLDLLPSLDLSLPPELVSAFQLANTIAPVEEAIAFTAVYGIELGVMTVYRHAKSMIPSPLPGGGGT